MKDRPEILVACRQNAGRSIAAGVLLDHYAEGRVVVRSAGSTPAEEIHPEIRAVLAERGLSTEGLFPKPFTDEMVQAADVVVSMGWGEAWRCRTRTGSRSTSYAASSTTSTLGCGVCWRTAGRRALRPDVVALATP